VSLVGEQERKVLKEIVKHAKNPVKQRIIAPQVIEAYGKRMEELEEEVERLEKEELAEKEMRMAENQMNRVTNRMENKPPDQAGKRVWFQTAAQKRMEKAAMRLSKRQPTAKPTTAEERADYDLRKSADYQARMAKRARKPKRILACVEGESKKNKFGSKQTRRKGGRGNSAFTQELTSVGVKSVKKFRHGPSDIEFKQAKRKLKAGKGRR